MKKNLNVGLGAGLSGLLFIMLLTGSCESKSGNDHRSLPEINEPALENMIYSYAARDFVEGSISREDINKIVECGIWAPSARNMQPWYFTIVEDKTLAKKIISNIKEGNIIIVVAAPEVESPGSCAAFDCGLATQNLYLAAQALGLGSRIYTGPVDAINSQYKDEMGFPEGYQAVALVRIGQVENYTDGVTSSSVRKDIQRVVTFK